MKKDQIVAGIAGAFEHAKGAPEFMFGYFMDASGNGDQDARKICEAIAAVIEVGQEHRARAGITAKAVV